MKINVNAKPTTKKITRKKLQKTRNTRFFFYMVEIPDLAEKAELKMARCPAEPSTVKLTSSKALHVCTIHQLCLCIPLLNLYIFTQ